MKKIGLLGGMSWESTATYYRIINETVAERAGGVTSADMVIRSLNLSVIAEHQSCGRWDQVADILCTSAAELEQMQADFIVMASNTVHKVYDSVNAAVKIPVIHIAEPVAAAVKAAEISKIGLLGTKYTMEGDFLKEKMNAAGIEVAVPDSDRFGEINDAIFGEGCTGRIKEETKEMFRSVISELKEQGAGGIVLGCTELGLFIKQEDWDIPVFDTAVLHALRAAEEILNG